MRIAAFALILVTATGAAVAGGKHDHKHDDTRQLGAHEHGRGSLGIAIEGNTVSMELKAPGADIVGFERPAKSKKEKAAVEAAKKKLAAALKLFVPPADAGCKLTSAKVELEIEDAHGGDAGGKKHDHGHDHKDDSHSEFHAQYGLTCSAPERLTGLTFDYFKAFKGANALEVQVIGPKGQTKYDVTRKKPALELAGVI